ncbi:helix-turn-helix domain-containing protein [Candidatus Falkowbacteria bacterium]|nr:helix-turn-helix domain-containing protein [Candidatus Falkowbacteria bacterium]
MLLNGYKFGIIKGEALNKATTFSTSPFIQIEGAVEKLWIKTYMATSRKNSSPEIIRLGDYLKKLRKEMGLSIHGAAKTSQLTAGYISRLENGQFKTITAETLVKFSRTYNIPVNLILERAGLLEKQDDLPGLATYLKIKYDAPFAAIQEMKIAWEIIEKKYQNSLHKGSHKQRRLGGNQPRML